VNAVQLLLKFFYRNQSMTLTCSPILPKRLLKVEIV
jgi:hypothetical protein